MKPNPWSLLRNEGDMTGMDYSTRGWTVEVGYLYCCVDRTIQIADFTCSLSSAAPWIDRCVIIIKVEMCGTLQLKLLAKSISHQILLLYIITTTTIKKNDKNIKYLSIFMVIFNICLFTTTLSIHLNNNKPCTDNGSLQQPTVLHPLEQLKESITFCHRYDNFMEKIIFTTAHLE